MARILIITGQYPTSPFIIDQAAGLADRGWEVLISPWRISADVHEHSDPDTVRSIPVRSTWDVVARHRKRALAARSFLFRRFGFGIHSRSAWLLNRVMKLRAAALLDMIREFDPDVVYANWGKHGMPAAVAARCAGVPACVHFRGYDVTRDVKKNGWDPYRRTLVGTTAVCHSEFIEELLRANLQLPVRRIRYGGIDRGIFTARARGSSWPVPLKLVCVGRLAPQKGFDTAIEALARIRELKPELDARLMLVGGGNLLESLRTPAGQRGVGDVVEFTGPKTRVEVAESLSRSDVLLVPSRVMPSGWAEAFGNVAVEGMVSGLPVIGTDCGGLPGTIGDGGILVPQDDPEQLAVGVIGLVASGTPEAWRARALIWSERYSREAMMADYDAVAREVAGLA